MIAAHYGKSGDPENDVDIIGEGIYRTIYQRIRNPPVPNSRPFGLANFPSFFSVHKLNREMRRIHLTWPTA